MDAKDVNDAADSVKREAFKFMCRHLVAIIGTYVALDQDGKPSGIERSFVYSGFVVAIRSAWLIATAGHNLKDFETKLARIKLGPCYILDSFGPGEISRHPIPFDIADAPKFYIYEEDSILRIDGEDLGLDFGLFALNSNIVQLLKANNVVAVSEENMRTAANDARIGHLIVGFPECFQDQEVLPDGRVTYRLTPILAGVSELDPPPDDLPATQYPRFVGQLLDNVDIDITGMSGGPIIGFSLDRKSYWIVAIQSKWLQKPKITFGCPTPVFLHLVEEAIQGHGQEA